MGGVRARVGFFGGTTDLGLAQRIWSKTDKARVRRWALVLVLTCLLLHVRGYDARTHQNRVLVSPFIAPR